MLKYERTEYAKKIRKDYEAGNIKERRCNLRQYTFNTSGCANTLTTVEKDNYLVFCVAMRGRYEKDGTIKQQLEMDKLGISNTLTSVQKDNLLVETYIEKPLD